MKPLIGLTAALLLALAQPAGAEVRIVTTLTDLASLAELVGGDRVRVDWIADGDMDPHYVELLPSYMLKVRKADLFIQVGLDFEYWSQGIIDGARNSNLTILNASNEVEILNKPKGPVTRAQGDIHLGGNPHVWLDPENGRIIAAHIAEALGRIDPDGAAYYADRLQAFEERLDAKQAEWAQLIAPYRDAEIVYFHDSWPYFNRAFGFRSAGFIEPKPGINPSAGHTAELIELIRAREIRVIAIAPFFSTKVPESIARQTGAKLVTLATSVGGVEGADDYFSLFDVNLRTLVGALGDAR